jgi:kinesin family member 1
MSCDLTTIQQNWMKRLLTIILSTVPSWSIDLTIDERHDVIARIEVQEMTASGKYEAVECRRTADLDSGIFILRLGVQRRLRVTISHSSGNQLHFKRVVDVKLGSIREVDARGRLVSSLSGLKSYSLRVLSSKSSPVKHESNPVDALTTFEASVSDADVMDRKTPPGNRILISLTAALECERVLETIPFSMDLSFEVHSRNSGDPGWLSMFTPIKPMNIATYGLFELILTPTARRGRRNMWKRVSAQTYIPGEENLGGWKPRGVSLLEDHHACKRSLANQVDLEIAKCRAKGPFEQPEGSEEEYTRLLQYCVTLWKTVSLDRKSFVSTHDIWSDCRSFLQQNLLNRSQRRRKRTLRWSLKSNSSQERTSLPLCFH